MIMIDYFRERNMLVLEDPLFFIPKESDNEIRSHFGEPDVYPQFSIRYMDVTDTVYPYNGFEYWETIDLFNSG